MSVLAWPGGSISFSVCDYTSIHIHPQVTYLMVHVLVQCAHVCLYSPILASVTMGGFYADWNGNIVIDVRRGDQI